MQPLERYRQELCAIQKARYTAVTLLNTLTERTLWWSR